MIIQILWFLLLIVLVIKGYYKTVAAIILLPLVLIYGIIFLLASKSRFDNESTPSRFDMQSFHRFPNLQHFPNLNDITAVPIKYEPTIISQ
jgi:hypothetical protein